MLAEMRAQIQVPRLGPGRPRTRPDAVITDRAYASRVTRSELPRRKVTAVHPRQARPARRTKTTR